MLINAEKLIKHIKETAEAPNGKWKPMEPEDINRKFDAQCSVCAAIGFSTDHYCALCGVKMDIKS